MKSEGEQKRDKNQNKMTKESSKLEKPCKFLIVIYGMDSIIEFLWMFVAVFLLISAMDHMKSPKSAIEISSAYGLVFYSTQTCCVGWLGSIIEYKSVLVPQSYRIDRSFLELKIGITMPKKTISLIKILTTRWRQIRPDLLIRS